jgi:hypothetical protein
MNTYDPAHYIRYVHLDRMLRPPGHPDAHLPTGVRLPSGHATFPLTERLGAAPPARRR